MSNPDKNRARPPRPGVALTGAASAAQASMRRVGPRKNGLAIWS